MSDSTDSVQKQKASLQAAPGLWGKVARKSGFYVAAGAIATVLSHAYLDTKEITQHKIDYSVDPRIAGKIAADVAAAKKPVPVTKQVYAVYDEAKSSVAKFVDRVVPNKSDLEIGAGVAGALLAVSLFRRWRKSGESAKRRKPGRNTRCVEYNVSYGWSERRSLRENTS